jgi:DNA-binding PadR family transcriptional regulator
MYELFILSKLMHRPMHAYLLQAILNSAVGPFRRVSWGTLYPLMNKLESEGFIVAVDKTGDDPRGKKKYRTTKTGRRRFFALISKQGDFDTDTPDLFSLKVGCFGHLDPEARLSVLADHRNYLSKVLAHVEAMTSRLRGETELPTEEQKFALLALQHKKTAAKAELRWIASLLERPNRLAAHTR